MLEIAAGRLRTTRWIGRAPRHAITFAGIALALVGTRSLLNPPSAPVRTATAPASRDVGSEALAEAFARDYLTWTEDADDEAQLATYGPEVAPPAPPVGVAQTVSWTTVASVRASGARTSTVTVVASTSRGRYALAVTIGRGVGGTRRVIGQPAVVGALPATREATRRAAEREVADAALTAAAERALRNYLARDRADLMADLAPNATVVLPDRRLDVRAVDDVTWVRPGRRVAIAVRVRDADGVEMTLRYELAVRRTAGRWLVRAIHTNPEVQ